MDPSPYASMLPEELRHTQDPSTSAARMGSLGDGLEALLTAIAAHRELGRVGFVLLASAWPLSLPSVREARLRGDWTYEPEQHQRHTECVRASDAFLAPTTLDAALATASSPECPEAQLHALYQAAAALWLRVAAHPQTPEARLRWLAQSNLTLCLEALAGNPSTPVELFGEVGRHCPARLLANESFLRAAEADPALAHTLPDQTAVGLLTQGALPLWLALVLAEHPSVWVRRALAREPGAPPEALQRLLEGTQDPTALAALARHPRTPSQPLAQLAAHGDPRVRLAVARNPSASAAHLESLSVDADSKVRLAVASHPSTPAATLERLALARGGALRAALARHPAASDALRRALRAPKRNERRG